MRRRPPERRATCLRHRARARWRRKVRASSEDDPRDSTIRASAQLAKVLEILFHTGERIHRTLLLNVTGFGVDVRYAREELLEVDRALTELRIARPVRDHVLDV